MTKKMSLSSNLTDIPSKDNFQNVDMEFLEVSKSQSKSADPHDPGA